MDLVTIFTACALGLKVELFVPLGALDSCISSLGAGAAVAPRTRSPIVDRWGAYITGQRSGSAHRKPGYAPLCMPKAAASPTLHLPPAPSV